MILLRSKKQQHHNTMITIHSVETPKQKKQFIHFPWKIYTNDPMWVPPLLMDMKKKLNPKFSFFEFGSMQMFLAMRGDEIVGRIAALQNDLYNKEHEDKTGFFGFFECIDNQNVANLLFDTAKKWLQERGRDIMHGPASPSSNHDYGLLVKGFDTPPRLGMVHNPTYYQALLENYGFKKTQGLFAYKIDANRVMEDPKMVRGNKIVRERTGVTIRNLNMKDIKGEIEILRTIYNEAWEKNYGFVPMTDKEIDEYAAGFKQIAEASLIFFAEIDGKPIGTAVSLLDYNYIFKQMNGRLFPFNFIKMFTQKKNIKWARVMLLGILPKYRGKGIDAVLYYETVKAAQALGVEYGEASWILEDNAMMRRGMELIKGEIYKTYNVYEVEI